MPLHKSYRLFGRSIFSLLFLGTINAGFAEAQVIPDGTLPTTVEQLGNMDKITGGERVGNNLFHSFEQFSIPEGMEAIFENGLDIENIFTRVTGGEASFIDGLLQTAGGANFFLINPNGIVFGENARLDIGGSFIATTADRVEFADGNTFSARGDEKPLLTWNAPIGLGLDYSYNNGSITVNGSGNQIINDSTLSPIEFGQTPNGLSVNAGQTLALVGSSINFNGGVVTTEGGNIYLGSVESGVIGISQGENGLGFSNDDVTKFQDINLNQQSLVNSSGETVGNISLIGENINLSGGSFVFARNEGVETAGLINITASETLNLSGASPDGEISSNIQSEAFNTGKGANVNIRSLQLQVQDEGRIQANTFSGGDSGNINFNVSNSIKVDNSRVSSFTFAEGNAANIQLSTSILQLNNGGTVTSSTIAEGNGGDVTINSDLIEVIGDNSTFRINRTNISASSFSGSQENPGNAGNLTISTRQLRVKDGGSVSSSAFGTGNGGNLSINASEFIEVTGIDNNTNSRNPESTIRTAVQVPTPPPEGVQPLPPLPNGTAGSLNIDTPVLNVTQQGVITVENQGTGEAGTLTINADTLNLDETGRITANAVSGIGGNITLNAQNLNISNDSQITTTAGSNQNGGNITINTTNLNAKKNGDITANSLEGDGGNVEINAADTVSLNDGSDITARSELGNGGNITLDADQIQIFNNSNISASALGGDGNGGNVTIFSDTFLAVNDSDVTARALRGNGGNILIDANALLGIEEREAVPNNGTSDADASSEFGEDGTVTITNPQTNIQDPIAALQEPEIESIEPKFDNQCWGNAGNNPIVYTGRSGYPESPEHFDSQIYVPTPGFVPPEEEEEPSGWDFPVWKEGDPIINSNAVRIDENGDVYFVAEITSQAAEQLICKPQVTEADEIEEEIKN